MFGFSMINVCFFCVRQWPSHFGAENVFHSLILNGDSGRKFISAGILFFVRKVKIK